MNDPLGLFEDENSDPLGLFESEPAKKASFGTALKTQFAGIGNVADTALSTLAGSAAGLFGDDASAIDIEEQRKARALQRNQWANPDNEEISGLNKLGSIALTLPMQIANAGLSPADTADRLKAAGETNATAIGGAGIDAAGNALGMILPGFKQGTAAVRGLTGFGANAAQDAITKRAIQALADTEEGKRQFQPTVEDAAISGALGGVTAMVGGKNSTKAKPTTLVEKLKAAEPVVDTPAIKQTPDNYKATEGHDGQMALWDIPEQGRMPNPYEAVTGDWRIDENGMPVKTDLSMDVANTENILQRNLFGDELGPKHPQESQIHQVDKDGNWLPPQKQIPLTQAIDSMDWAHKRGALKKTQLGRGMDAPGELEAARMAAEPTVFNTRTRKQGGAINPEVFVEGFEKLKKLANGIVLTAKGTGDNLNITATRNGKYVGAAVFDKTNRFDAPAQSDLYNKALGSKERGTATQLYKFANELGNDIVPSKKLTEGGAGVWNKLEREGIAVDRKIPFNFKKQGGGLYFGDDKPKQTLDQFRKSFAGSIHERVQSKLLAVDNYIKSGQYKWDVGTIVSSKKTGKTYKITGHDVRSKTGEPMYMYTSIDGSEKGTFFSEKAEETLTPIVPFNFKKQGGGLLISTPDKVKLDNALVPSDDGTLIPNNPNVAEALKSALSEGKDGKLFTYFQSGATSAAMKSGSAAIKATAEIVQNAMKRADLSIRNSIFPAEASLKKLSRTDIQDLGEVFKAEMFAGKRFDADNLTKNMSVEQLNAYTHMRDMFDKSLDAMNDARLSKGQTPVTPAEAYLSSRWEGDFRRPIHDANGKLVWYLASNSKIGLESQTKALLKQFPDLVVDKTKDHVVRSSLGKTELQSMYTTMLDILGRDDPAIQKIQQAIQDQVMAEGESTLGQEKHFEKKAGIRGFIGDRPGHGGSKEAISMFQQQLQYAKNAFTWAEMQKAADDVKGIVGDPDLQKQQPNNVKFIREYFKNAIGHGEAQAMRVLDDNIRSGLGISPKILNEAIGDTKSFFILQKLAMSAGFTLTNVIQSTNVLPYLADLREQGYKGNPVKALSMGMAAGPLMMTSHYLKALGGQYLDRIPNQFLKDAIHYAEQNGVTARSVYDESPIQTSFNPIAKVANVASKTMTIPETFVRSVAFMTYSQMLLDSGKYADQSKLFQHAEELVNKSMVDYRATEKPLVFAKGGSIGNFMNTLQTYPMSFYNQYAYMAGQAAKGSPVPLLTMMVLQAALAGTGGIPYSEDIYQGYKYIKDNLVSTPTWAKLQDSPFLSDPKLWLMETLGNSAVYGALSDQTGLGMSSRISAPTVGNMLQSPVGPISDIAKQVGSLGKAIVDPTNAGKWAQAGMNSIPVGLQGLLETSDMMEGLTYTTRPDGTKVYMKTSDLVKRDGSVSRTPAEESIRKWGLRSQREVVERDVQYMTDTANKVANERSGDLVNKYYDAARRGDAKKAKELAALYVRLTGKEISDQVMDQQVMQEYLTGYEKTMSKTRESPQELLNIARMKKILDTAK